jgi:hypothetical protein
MVTWLLRSGMANRLHTLCLSVLEDKNLAAALDLLHGCRMLQVLQLSLVFTSKEGEHAPYECPTQPYR